MLLVDSPKEPPASVTVVRVATVAFSLGELDSALETVLIVFPLSPFHEVRPGGRVEKGVVPKVVAKGMGCGEGWVCAERMEMPRRIHERRM